VSKEENFITLYMTKLKGSYIKLYGLDQILNLYLSERMGDENRQKVFMTAEYFRNKISINFDSFEYNRDEKYCILRCDAV
jgi:hypothetical protein